MRKERQKGKDFLTILFGCVSKGCGIGIFFFFLFVFQFLIGNPKYHEKHAWPKFCFPERKARLARNKTVASGGFVLAFLQCRGLAFPSPNYTENRRLKTPGMNEFIQKLYVICTSCSLLVDLSANNMPDSASYWELMQINHFAACVCE